MSTASVDSPNIPKTDGPKELKLKFVLPRRVKKEEDEHASNGVLAHTTPTKTSAIMSDDSLSPDDISVDSDSSIDSPVEHTHEGSWDRYLIGGHKLSLPLSMTQLGELSTVFNMDVWDRVLSADERAKLSSLLPNGVEDKSTLTKLFGGDTFHFDNPVSAIAHSLQAGELQEREVRKQDELRYKQRAEYVRNIKNYHTKMVDSIIKYRRGYGIPDSHRINIYTKKSEPRKTTATKKDRKAALANAARTSLRPAASPSTAMPTTTTTTVTAPIATPPPVPPTSVPSPSPSPKLPSLPVTPLDSQPQMAASNTFTPQPLATPQAPEELPVAVTSPNPLASSQGGIEPETTGKKGKRKQPGTAPAERVKKPKAPKKPKVAPSEGEVKVAKPRKERVRKVANESESKEAGSPHNGEDPADPSQPSTNPAPAFLLFATLRDFFEANAHCATIDELIAEVELHPLLITHMPPFFDLPEFVKLALQFLAKPPTLSSAAQNSQQPGGGSGTGITYEDPIVRYDKSTQRWQWLDTGRSRLSGPAGDEHLQSLEQLFYFATARNMTGIDNTVDLSITMNRQQKCILTIEPSSDEMIESFQKQETERYKVPERPFVYEINKSKYIVAPMKRVVGNGGNKPREHFLLKTDRPAHINLLCLVRDAAARLPGGVGTRPDVSLLLRDSQYVVESTPDQQINTVVSGALDRLHSERDPCVKFDSDQKLWVYLHRHRTEGDFACAKTKVKRAGRKKAEKDPANAANAAAAASATPTFPPKSLASSTGSESSPLLTASGGQAFRIDPLSLDQPYMNSPSPLPPRQSLPQLQALRQQLSPNSMQPQPRANMSNLSQLLQPLQQPLHKLTQQQAATLQSPPLHSISSLHSIPPFQPQQQPKPSQQQPTQLYQYPPQHPRSPIMSTFPPFSSIPPHLQPLPTQPQQHLNESG
jgi:nuclear factor related to kappa-B-binding protein